MKEKILVTGAAGFIGYYLSALLLDKEYQVIGAREILPGRAFQNLPKGVSPGAAVKAANLMA